MDGWEKLIGKKIILFFDSGAQDASRRKGKLKIVTNSHIILETERGEEGISLERVIRFEVVV